MWAAAPHDVDAAFGGAIRHWLDQIPPPTLDGERTQNKGGGGGWAERGGWIGFDCGYESSE